MKLHDLKPNQGAKKNRKRVGRGYGSGYGKTAGRGTKGQNARTGGGVPLWHQGGDTPFFRRMPKKPGFNRPNRVEFQEVNVEYLTHFPPETVITPEILAQVKLIQNADKPVAILGRGDLEVALTVKAHRVSKIAQEKIEEAGGSVDIINE